MQKSKMYFETSKTQIYQDSYRPSSRITHFFRTLVSVIVMGQSPAAAANTSFYRLKKSR